MRSFCSRRGSLRPARWLWLLASIGCTSDAPPPPATARGPNCATPVVTGHLPATLMEASGLAISRSTPGVLWLVDDGNATSILAVDSTGRLLGTVRVTGVSGKKREDWEDITIAQCGDRHCLYIAGIGDNIREHASVRVHRVPEPLPTDEATEPATHFPFRYPDGPHDAEAIFVLPPEQLFVVTKGRSEAITVYRYPGRLRADTTVTLVEVQRLSQGLVQVPELVTGGAAMLDGSVIVLRTYLYVQFYRFDGTYLQPLLPGHGVDLTSLREAQGEGVGLREDGVIFLASEQGLESGPPPLSRLACSLSH